ncbi:MAG: hypothetical protein H0U18_08000 [Pyrinomonadaceae bacterium]|nr:hypothetical protein [Pyrinomonadaceae bacterium]
MDILTLAEQSLEHPPNYAYYGDLHEEDGWGSAFGQHRDSDALDRSNWEIITTDLLARFPDDCAIESSNHWAVGWVETLRVRITINPTAPITLTNLTDAFHAVAEWKEKLDDYPVADEEHWSQLEYDEAVTYLESEIPYMWNRNHEEDMPEHLLENTIEAIISDHGTRIDDIPSSAIEDALHETWIEGLIADANAAMHHPGQTNLPLP